MKDVGGKGKGKGKGKGIGKGKGKGPEALRRRGTVVHECTCAAHQGALSGVLCINVINIGSYSRLPPSLGA